jgi:hypothetical protein
MPSPSLRCFYLICFFSSLWLCAFASLRVISFFRMHMILMPHPCLYLIAQQSAAFGMSGALAAIRRLITERTLDRAEGAAPTKSAEVGRCVARVVAQPNPKVANAVRIIPRLGMMRC